ncbi:MAG TPA: hypothetical protein VF576_03490, partial [Rubricoccaceae bacterium]
MRLALLTLSVCLLSVASAQTTPYRPLAVGNTWTYAATTATSTNPSPVLQHYLRVESLRDTVVSNRAGRVMGCERFTLDGRPGGRGVAVAFLMPGGTVHVSGATECDRVYDGPAPYPPARISNPLVIGGTAYPMASVLGASYPVGPGGTHGSTEYFFDYADPVGLARFGYESISGASSSRGVWTLEYAVVDGQTYGLNPVADEAGPEGPGRLALTASPTPASDQTTLRLAGAARAEVTVYSVTGRRVSRGDTVGGTLTLDTRAWAPG